MSDWIFLSKGGKDPYINSFARGCKTTPVNTDDFVYEQSNNPIIMRGILKDRIIKKCWKDKRDFYFMDTGYFGNDVTVNNPSGWKYWHRITKNNLQLDNTIIDRPSDRWNKFNKKFQPWKKDGRSILLAVPDEKPCKFYGIELEQWKNSIIEELKKNTDRPIIIRERTKNRSDRMITDPLEKTLNQHSIFAVVTYNSGAAIESIFNGIPVFVLAPCHAARPISELQLSNIEKPFYPDSDLLEKWARHLSYGQFHVDEMRSGRAKKMLEEYF